ncbi:hypothetical protein ACOME3_007227 [Neoechinorhynchus agilis]
MFDGEEYRLEDPRKLQLDDKESSYLTLTALADEQISSDVDENDHAEVTTVQEERRSTEIYEPKRNKKKKIKKISILVLKLLSLLPVLYFFICSLDLLTSGFQLLSGKLAGKLFAQGSVLNNPIAGLMLGVFVTVLVQSSSTTSAIIVSMVSADVLNVKNSIPIIMGANVGTSVTNTIVALGQMDDREEFRRAFSGATIHDVFNWLNVIIQLPLQAGTGFLDKATALMVKNINGTSNTTNPQFLKVITDPLTSKIIQVNKTVVELVAKNISQPDDRLIKTSCKKTVFNETTNTESVITVDCEYLFRHLKWPDWAIGALVTALALIGLIICLVLMVKILRSLLEGPISKALRKTIDKDFPGIFRYLTPYAFLLFGMGATILVQSSSVFTSAITPLVGTGVIGLHRMYPLTLGSNIGTTVTAILSAFSSGSVQSLRNSLQTALAHLLFNIFGVCLWFVVPITRKPPLAIARFLGKQTAKYRWFALFYLLMMFLAFPGVLFGLSFAGTAYAAVALAIIILIIVLILILNAIMRYRPKWLPTWLRSWKFLPEPMRSLAPYDRALARMKILSTTWIRSHLIRPESSVTSMTKLFRYEKRDQDDQMEL